MKCRTDARGKTVLLATPRTGVVLNGPVFLPLAPTTSRATIGRGSRESTSSKKSSSSAQFYGHQPRLRVVRSDNEKNRQREKTPTTNSPKESPDEVCSKTKALLSTEQDRKYLPIHPWLDGSAVRFKIITER